MILGVFTFAFPFETVGFIAEFSGSVVMMVFVDLVPIVLFFGVDVVIVGLSLAFLYLGTLKFPSSSDLSTISGTTSEP